MRNELLVVFHLYCRTPFGRLHRSNPEIIELAQKLRRTPSAVAMKACNFATFDTKLQARHIKGLKNASKADGELWQEFQEDSGRIAEQCEAQYALMTGAESDLGDQAYPEPPQGPTEIERVVKTRRIQSFFRSAVLSSYDFKCAISGLPLQNLLVASHIIPWAISEKRRADPRNGLALNAIYDRAFDRGLLTFDEDLRMVLSPDLRTSNSCQFQREVFVAVEGQPMRMPSRFTPDMEALAYHREKVFMKAIRESGMPRV